MARLAPPAPFTDGLKRARAGGKGTYSFTSLGCPKNLVDSERMLGLLQLDGYELVHDPRQADFAVVNTCGFIEAARAESRSAIEEAAVLKRAGQLRGLIVTGCLAERQREDLLAAYPEIDSLVGVFGREEITRVADRLLGDLEEQRTVFRPAPSLPLVDRARLRATPRHYAYLKISEGCDRLCTFCAIPKMRGRHATKPIEEVVREAEELAADGVRELILVAQDTTYYGVDLYGRPRLADLLTRLEDVAGIEWIRLMYLYPMHFDEPLIDAIAGSRKIVPYLDLPLQHASDPVLKRMLRPVGRRPTEELLARLRERIGELVLRTTFITGFPGETDSEFAELEAFVRQQRFERVGVFTYSLEPDTPAARLPAQLPEEIKEDRRDRLMRAQQEVAFAWNEAQLGRRREVLLDGPLDGPLPDQPPTWIGRSACEAPDVDPVVYVSDGAATVEGVDAGANGDRLATGRIVPCEIVATSDYDLVGVAIGPPR